MKEYNVLSFTTPDDFMEAFQPLAGDGWIFEAFFPCISMDASGTPVFTALISYDQDVEYATQALSELGGVFMNMVKRDIEQDDDGEDGLGEDGLVKCLCFIGHNPCPLHE